MTIVRITKKTKGVNNFELVAVTRIHVLQRNRAGDLEARRELADRNPLEPIHTFAEYSQFMTNRQSVTA